MTSRLFSYSTFFMAGVAEVLVLVCGTRSWLSLFLVWALPMVPFQLALLMILDA
jgi:hypothetical protein